jgi:tight adherence protein C
MPSETSQHIFSFLSLEPSQMSLVIAALVCLTLLLVFVGLQTLVRYRATRQEWHRKIAGEWDQAQATSEETTAHEAPTPKGLMRLLSFLGESTKPRNEAELSYVRRMLSQAGYRSADAPIMFFGVKLFIAALLPVVFSLLSLPTMQTLPAMQRMFLLVLFAVVGFYVPNLWVLYTMQQRKHQLTLGFPDAMDLMVVCVEAGLGLDAAIQRTAREIQANHKVLSEELQLVEVGLRAGQSRQDALRNLSLRTGLEDVKTFTSLLVQTDKFGTNVAQALRVHAESMRTKRRLRAEEIAAKIPAKLMFPLICFILPCLVVVVIGPGIIRIVRVLLPTLGGN